MDEDQIYGCRTFLERAITELKTACNFIVRHTLRTNATAK